MNRIILGIVCILLSGYAYADVLHPEDPTIRGHIGSFGDDVCFDNIGTNNCAEGYVFVDFSSQWSASFAGINGCGITAENPVSGAVCPLVISNNTIAPCTPNQYVLVQTIISGHYFAVKAGATCGTFSGSETEVIFPCLSTDAFDPFNGCVSSVISPPEITVQDGYIKLQIGNIPPPSHCDDSSHEGRMIVDSVNDLLYICTQSGWNPISVDPP